MKYHIQKNFTIILLFISISVFSQNYTISGYVQEESNGENLIGVSVFDKSSNKGTSTNQYGFYSITLPKGKYEILYSFIGLKTIEKSINLESTAGYKPHRLNSPSIQRISIYIFLIINSYALSNYSKNFSDISTIVFQSAKTCELNTILLGFPVTE